MSNQGDVADIRTEVLVLGAGPGGYTAAFRAADLGKQVVLVERYSSLGGVCLNVGCIPSKALLHTAEVINEVAELEQMGVRYTAPKIDLDKMRAGKDKVVGKLTGGLAALAKQRKVQVVTGLGKFAGPKHIEVQTADGLSRIEFDHCIIACGSSPVKIPGFPNDDPRLIDSTGALALEDVPKKMLIVGGGIIGLEMASVYATLGAEVDIVELQDGLIPGCDRDLVRPLQKRLDKQVGSIMLKTKVTDIKAQKNGLKVAFEGDKAPDAKIYDRVLVAVGRTPNGKLINAEAAGVHVDERGFIRVTERLETTAAGIFAIGDVVPGPMLAHKASAEGAALAEALAEEREGTLVQDAAQIPQAIFTDPEIASVGLSESAAKEAGVPLRVGRFPFAALGKALGQRAPEGFFQIVADAESHVILGVQIIGAEASDLIAEAAIAVQQKLSLEAIADGIHAHPTLPEGLKEAAENALGRAIHAINR